MIDKGLFNNGMTTSEYDYFLKQGYESPIRQIQSQIQYQYEEDCAKAVQSVGFDVDKAELTKALLYDRNQYDKGFKDGRADAIEEFRAYLKTVVPCEMSQDIWSMGVDNTCERMLKENKNDA